MSRNILGIPLDQNQQWPESTTWTIPFGAVFYVIATILVLQRCVVRLLKIHGTLGLDDALIVCGWLCGTAYFVETTLTITTNSGSSVVKPEQFEFIALLLWLIEMAFMLSQCFIKLSVLAILHRLVRGTNHKPIRTAIYGAAVLTIGYSLAIFIALFLMCDPVPAYWRAFNVDYVATHQYHCRDQTVSNLLAGVVAVISDLYTIAIPWAISRTFGLPRKQALALNLVFTSGLIVTAASCLRMYHLYHVFRGENVPVNISRAVIWATVEIQLAIMCACMPSLRVFYRSVICPVRVKISAQRQEMQESKQRFASLRDWESSGSTRELAKLENIHTPGVTSQQSWTKDDALRWPTREPSEYTLK